MFRKLQSLCSSLSNAQFQRISCQPSASSPSPPSTWSRASSIESISSLQWRCRYLSSFLTGCCRCCTTSCSLLAACNHGICSTAGSNTFSLSLHPLCPQIIQNVDACCRHCLLKVSHRCRHLRHLASEVLQTLS